MVPQCQEILSPNKVIVITTKEHLEKAHGWIDDTLPTLYTSHIKDKLNGMALKKMKPCRLDKPAQTVVSTAYAKSLQLHFLCKSNHP